MFEDRDLDHDRLIKSLQTAFDRAEDMGVSDLLQATELADVVEDDGGETGTIDVAIDNRVRPGSRYLLEDGPGWLQHLMTYRIGVDRGHTEVGEDPSHLALPAAYSPREQPATLPFTHEGRR